MSAERINPESSTDNTTSRGVTVPFRVPLTHEAGFEQPAEKKSKRNRKKRKKELNSAASEQQAVTQAPDSEKPRSKGMLTMEDGEFTLWQRPEDPQSHASAKLGEKVIGVAARSEAHSTAKKSEQVEPDDRITETAKPEEPRIAFEAAGPELQPEEKSRETIQNRPNPFERTYEPVPPPQPPDPMSYRRRFWTEPPVVVPGGGDNGNILPPPHSYERLAQEPPYRPSVQHVETPAAAPSVSSKKYESDIAPGYQRSTADVSRAAWTGLLAGWWIGRRGKRKAVERARQAGLKQGLETAKANPPITERQRSNSEPYVATPRLEAEPMHTYPVPETGRTVVQPLSAEAHNPLRPPERQPNVITRVVEQIAGPSAAVAVFDRAVNRPALERRIEATPAIRVAAAKAAEAVVARPVEVSAHRGVEHQLGKRELLRLSKDIKVDGVPLKEIYKAKKIDEIGLRSVVDTYLNGGDVRQQLTEEIVVKEQTYERDPVLRRQRMIGERKVDSRTDSGRRSRGGGSGGGVGQTLSRALSSVAASTGSTARSAGRAIASGARTAQRDIIDNSNTADWLSITAVVVLYSIILVLLLT